VSTELPAVAELLDRDAIGRVLAKYAMALDRRDLDAVGTCFAPAARLRSARGEARGRSDIVALVGRVRAYAATQHIVSSILIDLNGDRAHSESYTIAHLLDASGETILVRGLRYGDEFVRTSEGWLITERVHAVEWMYQARAESAGAAPEPSSGP
jgi:hypothetical protein